MIPFKIRISWKKNKSKAIHKQKTFISAGFHCKGGSKHENTHVKKEACILALAFEISAFRPSQKI